MSQPRPQSIAAEGRNEARPVSRRTFLAVCGTATLALRAPGEESSTRKRIPIGLQMYSVRDDEKRDLMGTLKGLRKMGYECVEFWAPYFDWTTERAREVRKQLDDLGLRCYSNHTGTKHFADGQLPHVIAGSSSPEIGCIREGDYLRESPAGIPW